MAVFFNHLAMESFNSYFWNRNKCIHPFKNTQPCQLRPVYVIQIFTVFHYVPFFQNCQVTAVFQVCLAYQVNKKMNCTVQKVRKTLIFSNL